MNLSTILPPMHSAPPTADPQPAFYEGLDPLDQFKAIDSYVRDFERKMREWPTLAKMAAHVKAKELWKYGGYPNFTSWVENAAPTSARQVFEAIRLYSELKGDFTDDDLKGVPRETAKKALELSTSARKNPEVKKALKKPRSEFVAKVKEVEPDQHMEDDVRKTFNFSESEWDDIAFTFTAYREAEQDESISDEKIISELCTLWRESRGLEPPEK